MMSQRTEKILNWLNSEKNKDKRQLDKEKELFIRQIKKLNKEDFFRKPKKLTLWQRIKILVLGT
jgi:hypothetical protein